MEAAAAQRPEDDGGRPRRGPAPDPNALRRGPIVSFRATAALLARIDAAAAALGLSRAAYLRRRAAGACGATDHAPRGGTDTPTPRTTKSARR